VEKPCIPNGGCDLKLGYTQYIDSSYPKGAKPIILTDSTVKADYMAIKPVEFEKISLISTPLQFDWWYAAGGYPVNYTCYAGNTPVNWYVSERSTTARTYPTQAMKDKAFTMALSRIADSPFMGAVDIGELDETLKFMKKPFGGLRDAFLGYHRKNESLLESRKKTRKRPKKGTKAWLRKSVKYDDSKWLTEIAADTWLEYRYAVRPLIGSVTGLAEVASTYAEDLIRKVHGAHGANKTVSSTEETRYYSFGYDGTDVGMRRQVKVLRTSETKAAYAIRYIYYPWMTDAINLARYGISPTQVLSTTYELLKLSFVADWFVNIGQWIKAMEPKPQCKVLDVCYTQSCKIDIDTQDAGGFWAVAGDMPAVRSCVSTFSRQYMNRSIVTNNLQAPIPRYNPEWQTISRTLDALSLLWQPASKIASRYEYLNRRRFI